MSRMMEALSYPDENDDNDDSFTSDDLTQEEVFELQESLTVIFVTAKSPLTTLIEAMTTLNPKVAKVLRYIILTLIIPTFFQLCILNLYEAKKQTYIREEPTSSSEIVYNITVNQQFYIVDRTTPYYYEIEFFDEDTDELIQGYILKRDAQPVDLESEEAEDPESSDEPEEEKDDPDETDITEEINDEQSTS